MKVDLIPHW